MARPDDPQTLSRAQGEWRIGSLALPNNFSQTKQSFQSRVEETAVDKLGGL